MTPTEKARETRKSNSAKRKAYWKEFWEQEKKDKDAAVEAMRVVRDSPDSTPQERLEAVKIIEYALGYHHIPGDLKYQNIDHEATTKRLKKELEAHQQTE